jgi:hypothetical protein
MPNFTPWYRREEYALMREIMDDGETLSGHTHRAHQFQRIGEQLG